MSNPNETPVAVMSLPPQNEFLFADGPVPEHAPDLPLNAREPLHLSAGGVAFLSPRVES